MFRNVVFILLFLLIYGAVFLLGSYRPPSTLTDRTGNGEFSAAPGGGTRYVTERYGLEFSYEPDWVVFDGLQHEKQIRDSYSDAEIEDSYGCGIGDLVFLGGFLSPQASLRITIEKNSTIPPESFSSSEIQKGIDDIREWFLYVGAKWGSGTGFVFPAQGNNERAILYYYDYTYLGEYNATFRAALNVKGNTVMLDGYYNSLDGLTTLTDFAKNGLRVTASGNSEV